MTTVEYVRSSLSNYSELSKIGNIQYSYLASRAYPIIRGVLVGAVDQLPTDYLSVSYTN